MSSDNRELSEKNLYVVKAHLLLRTAREKLRVQRVQRNIDTVCEITKACF